MSTYCTIRVPGDKSVIPIINKAFERILEIEQKFNHLNQSSAVYKFNEHNEPISDPEIVQLIEKAMFVSKISNGAFDITIKPIVKLWGFYDDNYHLPKKQDILSALKYVDYKQLVIRKKMVTKKQPDVKIDLGSIAKGYAISEVINVLKKHDIKSALVDAGGDIYALGTYNTKSWRIGVRHPRKKSTLDVLSIFDTAIVTSGDYERFFVKDNIRYHHIFNPKTGYPANDFMSITVLASDPVVCDAWATALFVLGKEKSIELVNTLNGVDAMFITSDNQLIFSKGFPENEITLNDI